MKILVTGADGYIGFPLIAELTNKTQHEIIGIDNDNRNEWVAKIEGNRGRFEEGFLNYDRYVEIDGDLTNKDFTYEILAIHKPDVIIHLASQPSMPYSQINGERALYTQTNNVSMLLNLLWGAKENGLNPRFIVTTTTGIAGQHYEYVPEGQTLNMAGSWYHVSRGFDSTNLNLASRQFGFDCMELRTSIVYGIQTDLMRKIGLTTRFDTDFYFGTALNRFVKMGLDGKALTVYGKGFQTKPFISLDDTVRSIVNCIDYEFEKGHTILNQTTTMIRIMDLANMIADMTSGEVEHIENPRKEKEDFIMRFENREFLKILGREPTNIESEIKKMIDYLKRPSWSVETSNGERTSYTGEDIAEENKS